MWRIINGLSRGLRTRTPTPPSQTSPWTDENETANSSALHVGRLDEEKQSCIGFGQLEDSIPPETKITQRILGTPSEADILLREFFGPTWKNNKSSSSNDQGRDRSEKHRDIPDHILNGVGLGTAWMTVLVLGRAVITSWNTRNRRSRIQIPLEDNISTWQEFEHRYLNNVQHDFKTYRYPDFDQRQRQRKNTILHVLPQAISRYPILAAGKNGKTEKSVDTKPKMEKSIHINLIESFPIHKVEQVDPPSKQKSVSFDKNYLDDSDNSSTSSSASSNVESSVEISEEAVERFIEDARDCSGATYNILALQSLQVCDYKEAFQRFQLGSKEGYAKSHFNLALCYEKGLGTRKNMDKAMELYEKAAYKGHAKAQYNLAVRLLDKGGISQIIHAIGLLEKAATNGSVQAQSFLGAYLTKPGQFQDFKKAVKMFKMAAEQGDAHSKYHLGICLERGLGGLKKNLSKAFDLYSSAATNDHLSARYNMAMMLETGFPGMEKNRKVAQDLLKSAAKLGHRPSELKLKEIKRSQTTHMGINVDKHDSADSHKVYYSQGMSGSSNAKTRITNTTSKTYSGDADSSNNLFDAGIAESVLLSSPRMPSIPSLPNFRVIDRSSIFQHNMLHNTSVHSTDRNINKTTSNLVAKDPITDAVGDLLGLRRVSTTPANLCYHSPLVKGPTNSFSLEV